jgi:hypothetical protein
MHAARKEGVVSMNEDTTKIEGRLGRLEASAVRVETQVAGISGEVTETKHDSKDMRTRMEDGFQTLRTEMTDGFQALRKEMTDGFQAVRKEMTDGFQAVRAEIASAKIWALLIAAAILGVLARGFHWI